MDDPLPDYYSMRFIHLRELAFHRTLNYILIADVMSHVINLTLASIPNYFVKIGFCIIPVQVDSACGAF